MCVARFRNGAIIMSVGATSGMEVMSTDPSNVDSRLRGPSMTVLAAPRMTRAPSCSHRPKKRVVALARAGAEIAERDGRAMQRRQRREIRSRRGVTLDIDDAGAIRLLRHHELAIPVVFDAYAELGHLIEREIHVGLAGEIAFDLDGEPAFDQRRDGQEAGEVLAGDGARHPHRAAHRAGTPHRRRQVAVIRRIERGAHGAQRIDQILVRPIAHGHVAVDDRFIRTQRRERQHEPRRHRALAHVQFDAARRERAAAAFDLNASGWESSMAMPSRRRQSFMRQ